MCECDPIYFLNKIGQLFICQNQPFKIRCTLHVPIENIELTMWWVQEKVGRYCESFSTSYSKKTLFQSLARPKMMIANSMVFTLTPCILKSEFKVK